MLFIFASPIFGLKKSKPLRFFPISIRNLILKNATAREYRFFRADIIRGAVNHYIMLVVKSCKSYHISATPSIQKPCPKCKLCWQKIITLLKCRKQASFSHNRAEAI